MTPNKSIRVAIIEDDDVVWVHDYHLMPLARELRARGRVNPIGFFLHIPCAPPDILATMPNHEEILGSLVEENFTSLRVRAAGFRLRNRLASCPTCAALERCGGGCRFAD